VLWVKTDFSRRRAMNLKHGIGKIVYGVRKISPFTAELEDGKVMHKPSMFVCGDCRVCALLNVTCEELESPCTYSLSKCRKRGDAKNCEECVSLGECLDEKPCCWECRYLTECLEWAGDCGADQLVKDSYGCDFEEFMFAVKTMVKKR